MGKGELRNLGGKGGAIQTESSTQQKDSNVGTFKRTREEGEEEGEPAPKKGPGVGKDMKLVQMAAAKAVAKKVKNEQNKRKEMTSLCYRGRRGPLGAISHYQKHTELLILKLTFQRLVREVTNDVIDQHFSRYQEGGL